MKLVNSLIVVVVLVGGLLLALALSGAIGPAMPEVQAQERGDSVIAAAVDTAQPGPEAGGMPAWPLPAKPIPHHEPGQPARSGSASHQVTRLNAQGLEETVQLTGLDALLADGAITDPLQGNYQLVGLDKVMFGAYDWVTSDFSVQSFEFVTRTSTLGLMPNSTRPFYDRRFTDIAAGDLNGDYVDEQIMASLVWDHHIEIWVDELPGSLPKATSAPAVVAHPDGSLDLVVRGYDQALWRQQYNGQFWYYGDNYAGGLLLSAPAVASRASGELDVFGVGVDNQVYHAQLTEWLDWSPWVRVDGGGVFTTETLRRVPLPEIPAPAVAARGDNQLDLFRLGPDNTLWWCHSDDGNTWGAWQNLGGMLASGPGAVAVTGGGVEVYALGMDGALWYRGTGGDSGAWNRLETPDGVAGNAVPAPTSPDGGQVDVYLAGTERRVWSIHRSGADWGSWISSTIPAGSELAGGIAAAATSPTTTHLIAQMSDGSLQHSLNAADWKPLPRQGWWQVTTADEDTKAMPAIDERENPIFDITTGYFSGDGRQQVVLTYVGADDRLRLEVYDIHDGFKLTKTGELPPITPGRTFPRVAAGDVDGDGVDEIALVNAVIVSETSAYWEIRVVKVTAPASGNWDLRQIDYSGLEPGPPGGFGFGGTLRIAAGDIVPDTTSTGGPTTSSRWLSTGIVPTKVVRLGAIR